MDIIPIIIRGLEAQMDFLEAARTRHQLWADKADNIETSELHLEAVGAFVHARLQLKRLVEKYRQSFA